MPQAPARQVTARVEVLGVTGPRSRPQQRPETALAAQQAQHKVYGRVTADPILRQGPPILELLSGEYEPLLLERDACGKGSGIGPPAKQSWEQ